MNLQPLWRRATGLVSVVFAFLCLGLTTASAQNSDLSILKLGPSSLVAGTNVTYTVNVSNVASTDEATPSTPPNTLSDTLPAGMTFVSASYDPSWSCSTPAAGETGTITCTLGSPIGVDQTYSFTFVFHLDPEVDQNSTICNTASVSQDSSETNLENNSSTTCGTVGAPPPPPLQAHDVLISEFRLSGPNGNNDDFIELYCNRISPCDLSGAAIRAFDPGIAADFTYTFPPNTVIPARHYLLIGDSGGYSLNDYAALDFDVHNTEIADFFVDNEGIQLIGEEEGLVLDSVGFTGGGNDSQYVEGTGLQRVSAARPAFQYAYVRKRTLATNGLPQDTNDNANDFVLVSVTGTPHPGISDPPVLGAPGPQSLTSPLSYTNDQFAFSLVEPANSREVPPNRVRIGTSDSGTLSLRRSITNNTNEFFDYLAFRVIEISTLNSPGTSEQARLRLVTSGDAETFTNSQGRTVVIRGTILEFDSATGLEPGQPMGGGLNSTVHANLGQVLIAPGETVDVQFLLNVDKAGLYRFYVYVEAFATEVFIESGSTVKANNLRRPVTRTLPRRMINLKRSPAGTTSKKPKPKVIPKPGPTKLSGRAAPRATTATTPVRAFIIINRTPANEPKRSRRKVRVRRKSSPELKAKAEAKNEGREK